MEKQSTHSSHIYKVISSDGNLSFRRLPLNPKSTLRSIQRASEMGEDLLTWVSTTKSEGTARVNAILELIVELEDVNRSKPETEENTFGWQGRVFTARVKMGRGVYPTQSAREKKLTNELNHCFLRYKLSPWYWMTLGDYPILGWWSRNDRPKDEDDPAEDVWFTEEDAIIAIIDLAREGLLCKIRRCHCGDWFFAKKTNQKFCCVRCQQACFRSSETYKAQRRAYMKELRALHKRTYLPSPKDRANKSKRAIRQ